MLHSTRFRRSVLYAVAGVALIAGAARAETVADFYRGKTVTLLMGTGPGGSYQLYGQVIADHIGKHIPGQPTIIIEHMEGAGGAKAGNYIYSAASQDGTKLLETHSLPLVEMLRGGQAIHFKSARFQWLGCFDEIVQVLALWHTSPVKTLDDLKTKKIVLGSFNKTHLSYQWARLLQTTIDTPYKVITGYGSGGALNIAMERGEIDGWVVAWENLTGTKAQWLKDKQVNIPVQFGLQKLPELPNVPTLLELAPPDKKDVVEFLSAGTPIARGMAVGPKVPADRVAALRTAFDDTMKDPAFLAEAKKRKLAINPRNAAETQALVDKIVSASPDLIKRVKHAIGADE